MFSSGDVFDLGELEEFVFRGAERRVAAGRPPSFVFDVESQAVGVGGGKRSELLPGFERPAASLS